MLGGALRGRSWATTMWSIRQRHSGCYGTVPLCPCLKLQRLPCRVSKSLRGWCVPLLTVVQVLTVFPTLLGGDDGSILCLYAVLQAITRGEPVPQWCNTGLLIFIPQKVGPNAKAYSAQASNFRPLTLTDTTQKLVAKAVEHALVAVTTCCVHEVHIGFVGGRSMLESVLRIEGAIEELLLHMRRQCGVFLFVVAAAFPPVAQAWLWMVMRSMNVPPWLIEAWR